MNQYSNSDPVWGIHSPLVTLTGLPLLVFSSGRLSFAITAFLLLIIIYSATLLVVQLCKSFIPEQWRTIIVIMTVTFISSLCYFLITLINPVSALELYFMIFLIPVTFLSSNIVKRAENFLPGESVVQGLKEALILGGLIVAISLIRESLGYFTLSFPLGGARVKLLPPDTGERFALHILTASAGVLILLAYLIAAFRLIFRQGMNGGAQDE